MGYSYKDTKARIVSDGKVYPAHEVDELYVDACALSCQRYILKYKRSASNRNDGFYEVTYAWHEIIEPWDNARVRYLKWKRNKEVCAAYDEFYAARQKVWKIVGPGVKV